MAKELINTKKRRNERRAKIILYTISLSLLIVVSLAYVISTVISWQNFEKLSVEAYQASLKIQESLKEENIEQTKINFLKDKLKGGFFKEQDTTSMLYNIFKYEIYITALSGDIIVLPTQLLTTEVQGLENIPVGSEITIELRETMLVTALPDLIAEIGSITGGDQGDSLDSDNLKPVSKFTTKKEFLKQETNRENEFRITSVKYTFTKKADEKYTFVFSRMMPSRIENINRNNDVKFDTVEIGEGFQALTGFILG